MPFYLWEAYSQVKEWRASPLFSEIYPLFYRSIDAILHPLYPLIWRIQWTQNWCQSLPSVSAISFLHTATKIPISYLKGLNASPLLTEFRSNIFSVTFIALHSLSLFIFPGSALYSSAHLCASPTAHLCSPAALSYKLFPEFHNTFTFSYWWNLFSCYCFSFYMTALYTPNLDQHL